MNVRLYVVALGAILLASCLPMRKDLLLRNGTDNTISVAFKGGDGQQVKRRKCVSILSAEMNCTPFTVEAASGELWEYDPTNFGKIVQTVLGSPYRKTGSSIIVLEVRQGGAITAIPQEHGWSEREVLRPKNDRQKLLPTTLTPHAVPEL